MTMARWMRLIIVLSVPVSSDTYSCLEMTYHMWIIVCCCPNAFISITSEDCLHTIPAYLRNGLMSGP